MLNFVCPFDSAQMVGTDGGYECHTCGKAFSIRQGVADFLVSALDSVSDEERRLRDEQMAPESADYGSDIRNRIEIPFIVKYLDAHEGESILDVGCGKGRASLPLLEKGGIHVTGLDFSWSALTTFRRKAPNGSSVALARADVAHMPVPPATFDRAICSMLLPSLPTEELVDSTLAGISRALKPGGTFVVTVFNYGRTAKRLGYPKIGYFPGTRVLIRHFTCGELVSALSKYFKVERVVDLVHGIPKITTPIDRIGPLGVRLNSLIDRGWRLFPGLREYATVVGVECSKPR